jgi:DNA-binding NarL/FixJ family response regulator
MARGVVRASATDSRQLQELVHVQCSPRQAEILALVGRGFSDKQIALELQLSPHTVRSYLDRFLHDHGLANRAAAAVVWLNVTEGARRHSSRPAVAHRGDARSR